MKFARSYIVILVQIIVIMEAIAVGILGANTQNLSLGSVSITGTHDRIVHDDHKTPSIANTRMYCKDIVYSHVTIDLNNHNL